MKQVQLVKDHVKEFSPHTAGMLITHPSQWLDKYFALREAAKKNLPPWFILQVRDNKMTSQRVGEPMMRSYWKKRMAEPA
jgi:hypothetical protein